MRQIRFEPWLLAAAMAAAGCSAPEPQPRSVRDLAADPAVLNGVLLRCAERPRASAKDPECVNARVAADQLAQAAELERDAAREREFERQREERRLRDEQQRRAAEAATPKFDPYRSPVVTDDAPADAGGATPAPAAGAADPAH